jgi:dephospho-CoA kinase
LNALAESAGANTRVAEYFTNFGIEVVNMEEALRGRSTAELVVNPFDAHPNAATHALAAQRLAAVIMNR